LPECSPAQSIPSRAVAVYRVSRVAFHGVPAIAANATQTVALWFGMSASSRAYRNRLDIPRRVMIPLLVTQCDWRARRSLPPPPHPRAYISAHHSWLMLAADAALRSGTVDCAARSPLWRTMPLRVDCGASIFEFVVSVYGGYFGGGIGDHESRHVVGHRMTDIHAMKRAENGLRQCD